jgi:hypothetical protein
MANPTMANSTTANPTTANPADSKTNAANPTPNQRRPTREQNTMDSLSIFFGIITSLRTPHPHAPMQPLLPLVLVHRQTLCRNSWYEQLAFDFIY